MEVPGNLSPDFTESLIRARSLLMSLEPSDLAFPVQLGTVLQGFGLGDPLLERGQGRHGGLRKIEGRWHPVVYRPRAGGAALVPRERFTVAHEIGHALVEDRMELRAARPAEYWALERVCDEFAGRLLIPDRHVKWRQAELAGARTLLEHVELLARAARTSLVVAAKRLLQSTEDGAAWGIAEAAAGEASAFTVRWAAGVERHGLRTLSGVREGNPLFESLTSDTLVVGQPTSKVLPRGEHLVLARRSPSYILVASWDAAKSAAKLTSSQQLNLFSFEDTS